MIIFCWSSSLGWNAEGVSLTFRNTKAGENLNTWMIRLWSKTFRVPQAILPPKKIAVKNHLSCVPAMGFDCWTEPYGVTHQHICRCIIVYILLYVHIYMYIHTYNIVYIIYIKSILYIYYVIYHIKHIYIYIYTYITWYICIIYSIRII